MSVSWIDTPGSRLPSPYEPLDFTASSSVGFISVMFAEGRGEELVYRDSAFVYPYLESTKVGNTFALRRSGGWPNAPSMSVTVEEVARPYASTWNTLYEIDFRDLPSSSPGAAGAYDLGDGATWYAKGDLAWAGPPGAGALTMAAQLVSGSGLGFRSTANNIFTTNFGGNVAWGGRCFFLPLAQFATFNVNAPLLLQSYIGTTPGGAVLCGLIDAASSGAGLTWPERATATMVQNSNDSPNEALSSGNYYIQYGRQVQIATGFTGGPVANTFVERGILSAVSTDFILGSVNAPGTGWLSLTSGALRPGTSGVPIVSLAAPRTTNPGVIVGWQFGYNDAAYNFMRRLRVSQPLAEAA